MRKDDQRKGNGDPSNFDKINAARENGKKTTLTGKKLAFVQYYVQNWDITKSAKLAGYSEKTAATTGSSLLREPAVKEYLEVWRADMKEDFRKSHEVLTQYYLKALNVDLTDCVETDEKGNILRINKDFLKANGTLIDEISVGRHGVKFKIFNKASAAEYLNRHVGYYEADNKQKAPPGVQIYLPDNGRDNDDK